MCTYFDSRVDEYICEKGGWTLDSIHDFRFVICKYRITKILTFIPLPEELTSNYSLLNINNSEITSDGAQNKCFLWSILAQKKLAGLFGKHRDRYDSKVDTYNNYHTLSKVNIDGLKFAVTLCEIKKFERLNLNISFTVPCYDLDETVEFNRNVVKQKKKYKEVPMKHFTTINVY